MKRTPIFQLSNSILITKNLPLDIQINGDNIKPLDSDSNSLLIPTSELETTTTNTTNTTTTTIHPSIPHTNINNKFEHKCNTCSIILNDKDSRNEHYRSGVHRYNLKLKLVHLPIVSQLEYDELAKGLKKDKEREKKQQQHNDDEYIIDSESESESESELENENTLAQQGYQFSDNFIEFNDPKVKIISKDLKLQISVWKCILGSSDLFRQIYQQRNDLHFQANKGISLLNEFRSIVISSGQQNNQNPLKWVVLLCSGGRFAGSVNQIDKCIEHKAFHRYTTRKKQGGSQSSKDSQGQTKHSAGAGLRRYNEKRLKEEVEELLKSWKSHIDQCTYIFVFAPKGNTRDILFPPGSWLSQNDERIRNVPFPIIRPTYSETQRVSTLLFSVDIELINEEKEEIQKKIIEEERSNEERLRMQKEELARLKEEKEKEQAEIANRYRFDKLFEAVRAKDIEKVKYFLESDMSYDLPEPSYNDSIITPIYLAVENRDMPMIKYLLTILPSDINTCIPEYHFRTPLHKASETGDLELIEILLDKGADPTIAQGLRKETAYDLSANQKTRDLFREWAGNHLDAWDYQKSHIIPLTQQMKEEKKEKDKEKKKKQKEKEKLKKLKEKENQKDQIAKDEQLKKKMEEVSMLEQVSKQKLIQESKLTDREKRALAAETRFNGKKCTLCNSNILGIPFERLEYSYCSTKCVLAHKSQLLHK